MTKTITIVNLKDAPRTDGYTIQRRVKAVASPVPPSTHRYKYSLYCGKDGVRLVAYDNERGKGDHKHILGEEHPYVFTTWQQMLDDFAADCLHHLGVEV